MIEEFAVIDFETTGLSSGSERLIEVAAAIMREWRGCRHIRPADAPGKAHIPIHNEAYGYQRRHGEGPAKPRGGHA